MPDVDFTSQRLFVDQPLAAGGVLVLEPAQLNYLRNVLRFSDGDPLLVFNGIAGEWRARFHPAGKRGGGLEIIDQIRSQPQANDLWYLFAPLKHARLDYMVQKAVEMGVSRLLPVITERTQASRVNLERMRANIVEACEQCGVLNLPVLAEPVGLKTLLAGWSADRTLIFCDEEEANSDPHRRLATVKSAAVAVLIGPEGGFSPVERAELRRLPAILPISLGPRILRADTAAVAALAIVQSAVGDWRAAQP